MADETQLDDFLDGLSKEELEKEKLRVEIKKIDIEKAQLKRKWWRSPRYLSIVIPALIATLTFLFTQLSDQRLTRQKNDLENYSDSVRAFNKKVKVFAGSIAKKEIEISIANDSLKKLAKLSNEIMNHYESLLKAHSEAKGELEISDSLILLKNRGLEYLSDRIYRERRALVYAKLRIDSAYSASELYRLQEFKADFMKLRYRFVYDRDSMSPRLVVPWGFSFADSTVINDTVLIKATSFYEVSMKVLGQIHDLTYLPKVADSSLVVEITDLKTTMDSFAEMILTKTTLMTRPINQFTQFGYRQKRKYVTFDISVPNKFLHKFFENGGDLILEKYEAYLLSRINFKEQLSFPN